MTHPEDCRCEDCNCYRMLDAAAAVKPFDGPFTAEDARQLGEQVEGWANFLPAPPFYVSAGKLDDWIADFRRWEDEDKKG